MSSEADDADGQTGHHKRVEAAKVELDGDDAKPNKEGRTNVVKVETTAHVPGAGDACLVLLYPPGPDTGRRFPLTGPQIDIGRGEDADIQIDRDSVSRRHARLVLHQDVWALEDLGSTNGSYINDVPITKGPLRDGDLVRVGAAIFKFLVGSAAEASYHEAIYRMTIEDALTATHTKRYFLEFLEREIVRCRRHSHPLSLILIDVDHFRTINDTHGHLTGDFVLREIATRVREHVHTEQCFGRWGDEEFAIALPDTTLDGARTRAETIRELVAQNAFDYEGDEFSVTVSIGVVSLDGQEDALDFMKAADANLYRAKREGRNRVIAGAGQWTRWKPDSPFLANAGSKTTVVALALLARDQLLAGEGGAARVDDLEGLLYTRLREQHKEQTLSFGTVEGTGKLLVALEGRNALLRLRAFCLEAVRACAEARPQAQFAVGPVRPATERVSAIEEAVAGLDDELGALENGRYLPQPIAVALRALDDMTQARAKFVLELGETVIQWLALCTTADLLTATDAPKTVGALKRNLAGGVSMGRWHEILVTAVKESTDVETTHAAVWRSCFGDKAKRTELFTWFASLVEARNAFAHGATASDEHVARKIVDEHAPRLRDAIKGTLRPALALIPAEVELLGFEGDLQSYRMTRLVGDGMPAAVSMYSRRRMNGGLWLCDAFADRALPLEPFFIRDTCPKCGARELFLLTRLDQLEFRSPATGHVLATALDERPFSTEARECLDMLTQRNAKT